MAVERTEQVMGMPVTAHVRDPGFAPEGLDAAFAWLREVDAADAYATAAFAMGGAGPAWTAGLRGYEAMTVLAGERMLSTAGFRGRSPRGVATGSSGA